MKIDAFYKYSFFISLLLVLGLTLASCTTSSNNSKNEKQLDFTLSDLDGNIVKLSNYRGKVVVIDFWATWCSPCKKEIPTFNRFQNYTADNDEVVLLTIVNESGDASDVKKFTLKNSIGYPVLMGTPDLRPVFGLVGYPSTYILDKKGRISSRIIGSHHNLHEQILKAVAKASS